MILPIYIYGQPVLRQVAEDITADYPQLKELIADMWETLAESDGIGLAAPQIGPWQRTQPPHHLYVQLCGATVENGTPCAAGIA